MNIKEYLIEKLEEQKAELESTLQRCCHKINVTTVIIETKENQIENDANSLARTIRFVERFHIPISLEEYGQVGSQYGGLVV